MSGDLHNAEADLGKARAAYEVRPHAQERYVHLLECEARYLRIENRLLRAALAGFRRAKEMVRPGRRR